MSNATGFEDAQDQIRRLWSDSWSGTPLAIQENNKYEPDPTIDHVLFAVRETGSLQITSGRIGYRRWRILGQVVVMIYGKLDVGAGKVREYADSAAAIFRGIRLNNICFGAPKVVPVGRDVANYRINVMVPFQFDIIA